MDFLCACFPKEPHDTAAGGAPHDGIVDQHHPFSLHTLLNGTELDLHLVQPGILAGRNKGSADIFIFDQPDAVGNPGFHRKPQGGVQAGVGNAHHDIRPGRMLPGKEPAGFHPRPVHGYPVDHRIRSCKIDIFKDTELPFLSATVFPAGFHSLRPKHKNFPGLQIPHKFGSQSFQGAAFRCRHIHPVRSLSKAKGTKAIRISGTDQLLCRHQHKGICAVQGVHGRA